ncbi:hypothetical protein VIGAN_05164700 [Vigna angularis var. angularis]|uniref:Uncharacterized protein n=1 Tax=Vigna angularis var. angularis TaxID=157739 RepID=A0A0S3S5V9_PHAAN|nr:hypothetical protein VIGAN_05164700 [Vigna angularis var. angularis]
MWDDAIHCSSNHNLFPFGLHPFYLFSDNACFNDYNFVLTVNVMIKYFICRLSHCIWYNTRVGNAERRKEAAVMGEGFLIS